MKSLLHYIRRTVGAVLVGAAWLALVGCQSAPSAPPAEFGQDGSAGSPPAMTGTNMLFTGSADDLVPGNRIRITYSGQANVPPPHEQVIPEDGTIKPPLLKEPVIAAGKKVGQLQEELLSLYIPAYFKTLTITVVCDERYFWVGGEVKSPGQKPYLSQMTVLKAIQAAADFTDFAKRSKVRVTRANGRTETVNCSKAAKDSKYDRPVYPGDRIDVPRRVIW
jgi:polysaccharide biosynthesis/export protein